MEKNYGDDIPAQLRQDASEQDQSDDFRSEKGQKADEDKQMIFLWKKYSFVSRIPNIGTLIFQC